MDGFVFLPFGTSLHDIVSASIIIEGKRVKFDGRLMKSREKTSLLKQAEQGEMPN